MSQTTTATPTSPAPTADGTPRRRARSGSWWQRLGPPAVFLALLLLIVVLQPNFFSGGGIRIVALQATPILLIALGQAIVIGVGSLDLSNAAMGLLAAILTASTLGSLGVVSPVLCVALVTLVGLVNGLVFAYTQVPSFALTLGTLGILQAASLVLSDATTVYVTANADVLAWMFNVALAGLPAAFWMAVVLAAVLWAVLRFTTVGQGMTAVGLNETGAIFSGLRTRWLKVTAFTISGFTAGLAGLTIIAQSGAASSFGLGSDLLLPGIAAAIVGGTAITGGVTNPINVVFGAATIALLPIGAAAVGVPPQAQSLVYGAVIIVAVALTMSRARGAVVK
ncbi:MAG: ABC transporter permease [Nocardioidaceae bacterium]|nr:ABC transporter permease [Nocardioidaceae bacterium]